MQLLSPHSEKSKRNSGAQEKKQSSSECFNSSKWSSRFVQSLTSHLKLMGYNRESKLKELESGLTCKGYDLSSCILHCLERGDTDLFVMGECLLTKKSMKNSGFLSTPSPCKNREWLALQGFLLNGIGGEEQGMETLKVMEVIFRVLPGCV